MTGREVVRFEGASRGSHKTTTVRGGGGGRKGTEEEEEEERSPLREQLSKAWKRIADLETRVHDLTLQTTLVSVCLSMCVYICVNNITHCVCNLIYNVIVALLILVWCSTGDIRGDGPDVL